MGSWGGFESGVGAGGGGEEVYWCLWERIVSLAVPRCRRYYEVEA